MDRVAIGSFLAGLLILGGCPGAGQPPAGQSPAVVRQPPPATPAQVAPRIVHKLVGHSGSLFTIAFSPDGKRLASGDRGGYVKVWDVVTGQPRRLDTNEPVLTVAFAGDGTVVAAGKCIEAWDLATGAHKQHLSVWEHVTSIAFAADGASMVSEASRSGDDALRVWEVATGKLLRKIDLPKAVRAEAIAPDGRTIVAAQGKTIDLWDASSGKSLRKLEGHAKAVESVAFAPDGVVLASAAEDETIKLWEVSTGKLIRTIEGAAPAPNLYGKGLAFTPDGTLLAAATKDKKLQLWAVATGQLVRTLEGYESTVNQVVFGPDGKTLATADNSGTILVWSFDPAAPAEEAPLESKMLETGPDANIDGVAVASGGDMLASSGKSGTTLWDVSSGKTVRTLTGNRATFAPDGKTLATVEQNPNKLLPGDSYNHCDQVQLCDVATGSPSRTLAAEHRVNCVAFAPDGKTLAVANQNYTITLWDVAEGSATKVLKGHENAIRQIVFAPDGESLASASDDKTAKLWGLKTGMATSSLKHGDMVMAVAFSPDGKTLATANWNETATLWDVATGKELRTLAGHGQWLTAVAFAPDGKTLATGSGDKSVRLWEVASGKLLRTLQHRDTPHSLAFLPDGKRLASACGPGVLLWRLER